MYDIYVYIYISVYLIQSTIKHATPKGVAKWMSLIALATPWGVAKLQSACHQITTLPHPGVWPNEIVIDMQGHISVIVCATPWGVAKWHTASTKHANTQGCAYLFACLLHVLVTLLLQPVGYLGDGRMDVLLVDAALEGRALLLFFSCLFHVLLLVAATVAAVLLVDVPVPPPVVAAVLLWQQAACDQHILLIKVPCMQVVLGFATRRSLCMHVCVCVCE
jgi:hypothetical protein